MNIPEIHKSIGDLTPEFQARVLPWFTECNNKGLAIFPTETFRTTERQKYLYGQGRQDYPVYGRQGVIVTWTLHSLHCQGKAIDIAFSGSTLYPTDISLWRQVVDIAKKYGIDWGYDLWGTDKPHFQMGSTIPDISFLNSYTMDLKTQSAIKNKTIDSIASGLSALWNVVPEENRIEIVALKAKILSYKDPS